MMRQKKLMEEDMPVYKEVAEDFVGQVIAKLQLEKVDEEITQSQY